MKQQVYFNNKQQTVKRRFKNRLTEQQAIEASYKAFLGIGLMALLDMGLKDDFNFGHAEAEKFVDRMHFLFDSYIRGFINFDDISATVEEETGIKII